MYIFWPGAKQRVTASYILIRLNQLTIKLINALSTGQVMVLRENGTFQLVIIKKFSFFFFRLLNLGLSFWDTVNVIDRAQQSISR